MSEKWECYICGSISDREYCLLCGTPRAETEIIKKNGEFKNKCNVKKVKSEGEFAVSNVADIIKCARDKYKISSVYYPDGTSKATTKIKAAIKSYARGISSQETVILCYDSTFFGAADEGCILTDKKIYSRGMFGQDEGNIKYNDVPCNVINIDGNNICIGPLVVDGSMLGGDDGRKEFCELIKFIKRCVEKNQL